MQRLHVDGCLLRSRPAAGTERIGGFAFKLSLPRRDLIGVDIELLGKLRNGSIALDGASATFALKAGV